MKTKRGSAILSVVGAMVIIAILAIVLMNGGFGGRDPKTLRKDGKGYTVLGAARYAAIDEVCKENLRSVRQGIQLQKTTDDANPATLEDTRIGQQFYKCPVGKEAYKYDPATGLVNCPHPGHEKY